jgi:hypothetical protein
MPLLFWYLPLMIMSRFRRVVWTKRNANTHCRAGMKILTSVEPKRCLRCGSMVRRKVMLTAKYCSADCRQKVASARYRKAEKQRRALGK